MDTRDDKTERRNRFNALATEISAAYSQDRREKEGEALVDVLIEFLSGKTHYELRRALGKRHALTIPPFSEDQKETIKSGIQEKLAALKPEWIPRFFRLFQVLSRCFTRDVVALIRMIEKNPKHPLHQRLQTLRNGEIPALSDFRHTLAGCFWIFLQNGIKYANTTALYKRAEYYIANQMQKMNIVIFREYALCLAVILFNTDFTEHNEHMIANLCNASGGEKALFKAIGEESKGMFFKKSATGEVIPCGDRQDLARGIQNIIEEQVQRLVDELEGAPKRANDILLEVQEREAVALSESDDFHPLDEQYITAFVTHMLTAESLQLQLEQWKQRFYLLACFFIHDLAKHFAAFIEGIIHDPDENAPDKIFLKQWIAENCMQFPGQTIPVYELTKILLRRVNIARLPIFFQQDPPKATHLGQQMAARAFLMNHDPRYLSILETLCTILQQRACLCYSSDLFPVTTKFSLTPEQGHREIKRGQAMQALIKNLGGREHVLRRIQTSDPGSHQDHHYFRRNDPLIKSTISQLGASRSPEAITRAIVIYAWREMQGIVNGFSHTIQDEVHLLTEIHPVAISLDQPEGSAEILEIAQTLSVDEALRATSAIDTPGKPISTTADEDAALLEDERRREIMKREQEEEMREQERQREELKEKLEEKRKIEQKIKTLEEIRKKPPLAETNLKAKFKEIAAMSKHGGKEAYIRGFFSDYAENLYVAAEAEDWDPNEFIAWVFEVLEATATEGLESAVSKRIAKERTQLRMIEAEIKALQEAVEESGEATATVGHEPPVVLLRAHPTPPQGISPLPALWRVDRNDTNAGVVAPSPVPPPVQEIVAAPKEPEPKPQTKQAPEPPASAATAELEHEDKTAPGESERAPVTIEEPVISDETAPSLTLTTEEHEAVAPKTSETDTGAPPAMVAPELPLSPHLEQPAPSSTPVESPPALSPATVAAPESAVASHGEERGAEPATESAAVKTPATPPALSPSEQNLLQRLDQNGVLDRWGIGQNQREAFVRDLGAVVREVRADLAHVAEPQGQAPKKRAAADAPDELAPLTASETIEFFLAIELDAMGVNPEDLANAFSAGSTWRSDHLPRILDAMVKRIKQEAGMTVASSEIRGPVLRQLATLSGKAQDTKERKRIAALNPAEEAQPVAIWAPEARAQLEENRKFLRRLDNASRGKAKNSIVKIILAMGEGIRSDYSGVSINGMMLLSEAVSEFKKFVTFEQNGEAEGEKIAIIDTDAEALRISVMKILRKALGFQSTKTPELVPLQGALSGLKSVQEETEQEILTLQTQLDRTQGNDPEKDSEREAQIAQKKAKLDALKTPLSTVLDAIQQFMNIIS